MTRERAAEIYLRVKHAPDPTDTNLGRAHARGAHDLFNALDAAGAFDPPDVPPDTATAIAIWNAEHANDAVPAHRLVLRARGLIEFQRQYDARGMWIGCWDEVTPAGREAGLK